MIRSTINEATVQATPTRKGVQMFGDESCITVGVLHDNADDVKVFLQRLIPTSIGVPAYDGEGLSYVLVIDTRHGSVPVILLMLTPLVAPVPVTAIVPVAVPVVFRVMSPFEPTVMPGVFSSTSSVLLVALLIIEGTFTTVLSISCSINGRFAFTITSASVPVFAGKMMIAGRTIPECRLSMLNDMPVNCFCVIAVMDNR